MSTTTSKKKKRKALEHAEYMLRYALRMKEDLLAPEQIQAVQELRSVLKKRLKSKDFDDAEALVEQGTQLANELNPAPKDHYSLRENIEVLAVVIAVVMAFRMYIAQPYQIPTGSMQPTLYGVTGTPNVEKTWQDLPGINLVKLALTGGRYKEVVAKHSGYITPVAEADGFFFWEISDGAGNALSRYKIHKDFRNPEERASRAFVQKGQVLYRGIQRFGDHVIVNRVAYNFRKPERGDVVVFSTKNLEYVRPNSSYIKRLVGMPGEKIRVCDGRIYADDVLVDSPAHFRRQYDDPRYAPGYSNENAKYLKTCEDELVLADDEFLFMGDNTKNSLDGRWFGGVPAENVIGPAVFVPWPFFQRGHSLVEGYKPASAGKIW